MTASSQQLLLRTAVEGLLQQVSEAVILPRYQSLTAEEILTKSGPGDLVTIADEEAEQQLTEGLSLLLPGSDVVGEEAVATDPSTLQRLAQPGLTWVIDPIDGTANFVAGRDGFGVIVALVEDGETIMGWIHNPLSSQTLWAARGEGTWLGPDQLHIEAREPDISSMTTALYHRAFKLALGAFGTQTLIGSAAHVYWGLAESLTQVSSFSRLMPWDHAAGILIHEEAGGYSALLDGTPYKPTDWEPRGVLSAPSRRVLDKVRALADETKV